MLFRSRAHNVRTGKQFVVLKTHTKFVYIDEDGAPLPLKDKSIKRINDMIELNKLETEDSI